MSDDHAGLRKAIAEILPEAAWQRCYVHFLRNALDYLPRKADDDCLQELRWLYARRNLAEAQHDPLVTDFAQMLSKVLQEPVVQARIGRNLLVFQQIEGMLKKAAPFLLEKGVPNGH